MSTTEPDVDADRLGLGWEVWFLLGTVLVGGVAFMLVAQVAAVPVSLGASVTTPLSAPPTPEVGRMVAGGVGALLLAAGAVVVNPWSDDHDPG